MDLLLTLAAPIDQRQRDQFLHEVAAELEAKRQAGEIGEGTVHRLARMVHARGSKALLGAAAVPQGATRAPRMSQEIAKSDELGRLEQFRKG
jgi:hypothetical protein